MFRDRTNDSPSASGRQRSTAFWYSATGRSTPSGIARQPAPSSARLTISTPPSWRSPWTVPIRTVRAGRRRWPAGPGPAAGPSRTSRLTGRAVLLEDVALAAEPALADLDQGRLDHPLDQLDRREPARPAGRAAPRPRPISPANRRSTSSEAGGPSSTCSAGGRRGCRAGRPGSRRSARRSAGPAAPASPGPGGRSTCSSAYRRCPEAERSGTGKPYRRSQTRRAWQLTPVNFDTAAIEYSAVPGSCHGPDLPAQSADAGITPATTRRGRTTAPPSGPDPNVDSGVKKPRRAEMDRPILPHRTFQEGNFTISLSGGPSGPPRPWTGRPAGPGCAGPRQDPAPVPAARRTPRPERP